MNAPALKRKRVGFEAKQRLEELAKENSCVLNPRVVVDDARNEDSPLHSYFDWNDGHAAEQWRLFQAGVLVRRIKVFIVKPEQTDRRVEVHLVRPDPPSAVATRRFVSLPSQRNSAGGYMPVEHVLSDAEQRAELMRTAMRELRALREKYQILEGLADVWAALDRIV